MLTYLMRIIVCVLYNIVICYMCSYTLICTMDYFSAIKSTDACYTDEPRDHYTACTKPDTKGPISSDSICVTYSEQAKL